MRVEKDVFQKITNLKYRVRNPLYVNSDNNRLFINLISRFLKFVTNYLEFWTYLI